ncbi:hypothetical protein Taro_024721 [Colocasia esculenta]|uniref:Uncharacterized protein n=1 Tax=Colocasia esculenta TaxID=4460 RepID=A0A843VFA7_COLES|nr:hypothetical protein [Colocasia esculenta]
MAASLAIEKHREGAEVHRGHAECREKLLEVLKELCLPPGLHPLEDIEEFGYNRATGFFWVVQKKNREHTFKRIKQQAWYASEMTAFVERRRVKKITGIKAKQLLLWLSVTDMYIDDPASGKITFKTATGFSVSFPVSAFELE